jgi:hypothetical protein
MTQSLDLLRRVRSQLALHGTSLTKWCEANDISRQWATTVLVGKRNGPAAKKLRQKLIKELNLKAAA